LENVVRKFLVLRDARLIEQDLRAKLQRKTLNNGTSAASAGALPTPPPVTAAPMAPLQSTDPVGMALVAAPVLEQVAREKREAERVAIVAALKSTNWNRKQAAQLLHIDYKALLYKMNRLVIKKEKVPPRPIQTSEAPAGSAQAPAGQCSPAVFARGLG
jgi:DNA-binding NtrC family response regulator